MSVLHLSLKAPDLSAGAAERSIFSLASGYSWYALHTRSRFEKRVAVELTNRGVESFLPLATEIHQWKDRRKAVEIPIFPGYVFFRTRDCATVRLTVLQTPGAVRILSTAGRMEPVPEQEIHAIQKLLRSELPCLTQPFLKQGAWVKVKNGPLKGIEGRLIRIKNRDRLVLSVDLLQKSVATEIDRYRVEVVHPPSIC